MTSAAERDLAIRNLDLESNMLRNTRAARRQIEDGTFGQCTHCEEEIGQKRLAAVPWTPFCIRCQEGVDQHVRENAAELDGLLTAGDCRESSGVESKAITTGPFASPPRF
jgi:DnaK suppressor protein